MVPPLSQGWLLVCMHRHLHCHACLDQTGALWSIAFGSLYRQQGCVRGLPAAKSTLQTFP